LCHANRHLRLRRIRQADLPDLRLSWDPKDHDHLSADHTLDILEDLVAMVDLEDLPHLLRQPDLRMTTAPDLLRLRLSGRKTMSAKNDVSSTSSDPQTTALTDHHLRRHHHRTAGNQPGVSAKNGVSLAASLAVHRLLLRLLHRTAPMFLRWVLRHLDSLNKADHPETNKKMVKMRRKSAKNEALEDHRDLCRWALLRPTVLTCHRSEDHKTTTAPAHHHHHLPAEWHPDLAHHHPEDPVDRLLAAVDRADDNEREKRFVNLR